MLGSDHPAENLSGHFGQDQIVRMTHEEGAENLKYEAVDAPPAAQDADGDLAEAGADTQST